MSSGKARDQTMTDVTPAVIAVSALTLAVLVPLGAVAGARSTRRLDGSRLPQPYQRRAVFSIGGILSCLVIFLLIAGLAPQTALWLLVAFAGTVSILTLVLAVRGFRRARRALLVKPPGPK